MNVGPYLHLIPQLEQEIEDHRLDSLICGMGPTAWLLRYMSRKVTQNLRLWGCHDGCRIMPMDDLVIMDSPINMLHPDTQRHMHIIESRPKRLWIYKNNYPPWQPLLPKALADVTKVVDMGVWRPETTTPKARFKLETNPVHTLAISPTGMTTLAWSQGCRRIGVIGADMMAGHHHTNKWVPIVDAFFTRCAEQAHEKGGVIVNLSPISALKEFRAWTPSVSSSAPSQPSDLPKSS